MNNEFLKNLKESLDSGKENKSLKNMFNDIVDKANIIADDPTKLKEAEDKLNELSNKIDVEETKKLTAEDISKLNEFAKIQQQKIDAFEENLKLQGALGVLNNEIGTLTIKILDYKSMIDELNSDIPFSKKNEIIKKALNKLND